MYSLTLFYPPLSNGRDPWSFHRAYYPQTKVKAILGTRVYDYPYHETQSPLGSPRFRHCLLAYTFLRPVSAFIFLFYLPSLLPTRAKIRPRYGRSAWAALPEKICHRSQSTHGRRRHIRASVPQAKGIHRMHTNDSDSFYLGLFCDR
jgi:hypothetical protein